MQSNEYVSPPRLLLRPAWAAPPINVTLFYEGLCPACHRFILHQLWPTYGKLEDYVILDLLPFGNAHMKVDNGTVTFTCQHGKKECYVNEVQTCAVKYVHPTRKLLELVACMFQSPDPTRAGEPCARKVNTDWPVLDKCSRGPEGTQLLWAMGQSNPRTSAEHRLRSVDRDQRRAQRNDGQESQHGPVRPAL
ncbi:hypothetical protein MTO96_017148 [Rhipicephalus appendiculatus]